MAREFQFYIVPTPIGNIKDITFRAVEILKFVDIIACEDSRVTQKLLNHYEIKTKTISYHKYNEKERVDLILSLLNDGKKVALVSDAGTPMICDPGSILLRELTQNNITVTSLAGACAVPTFLSQVPRDSEEFVFVGFMPKTSVKIEELYHKYKYSDMVFYDSPNRIVKTLEIIAKLNPSVKVVVGRELTKMFEEVVADDINKVIEHFKKNEIKGEIVAMIHAQDYECIGEIETDDKINILKSKGFKSKEIAEILSSLYGLNKNELYKKIIITQCNKTP